MDLDLYPHQIDAIKRMKNGCILNGTVGSGKSRMSLTYYFVKIAGGNLRVNGSGTYSEPKNDIPLYIITTAKKRDSKDWESEMAPFLLSTDPDISVKHEKVVVDSWNNIKKYAEVKGAFFIFDEDRVTGDGAWVKAFLKIAKSNRWIILSATPGDNWLDYVPVFIANGYYKNKTEFNNMHVIWQNCGTFWKPSDKFMNTKRLEACKRAILIEVDDKRLTVPHKEVIVAKYDIQKYKSIMRNRWDPYEDEPIENVSKLCYLLRKVGNSDPSRIDIVKDLLVKHDRCIIFYNFDYELDILRQVGKDLKIKTAEWNGHNHDSLPTGNRWIYLCQYTSASEGWNAITTNAMIFFSLSYSYKTMVQSEGRINRMNTPYRDLYYYYIRCSSPIDLAVMSSLRKKKKFNERKFIGTDI